MERMISAGGRLEVHSESHLCQHLREAGVEQDIPATELQGSDPSRYTGRGRLCVLRLPDTPPIVVKALRHGGALAFLWRDWFPGPGRLLAAVELLQHLERSGVATPRVAFARIRRCRWIRLVCRLELATYEVPDSIDLRAFLEGDPTGASKRRVAEHVGRTLRELHDSGVHHADLNVKNLLVVTGTNESVLVLDVEGSRRSEQPLDGKDAVKSFKRLLRSLVKTGLWRNRVGLAWAARVLRSYRAEDWRTLWAATRDAFQRTEPCHRLAWSLSGVHRAAACTRRRSVTPRRP